MQKNNDVIERANILVCNQALALNKNLHPPSPERAQYTTEGRSPSANKHQKAKKVKHPTIILHPPALKGRNTLLRGV
jgi:hypothetical protein